MRSDTQSVAYLRQTSTIRERANMLLDACRKGDSEFFDFHADKMDEIGDYVCDVIKTNYPDLSIPYHSRWRHFETGGVDRWGQLKEKLPAGNYEQARAAIDLAVTSVLLDAGAGDVWQYHEKDTHIRIGRSEGLGIASFHMFCHGLFSSDANNPYQADATGLKNINADTLAEAFQISDDNPMSGLEGRIELVRSLANILEKHPDIYGTEAPRPGNMLDVLYQQYPDKKVPAKAVLDILLKTLSDIWPGRTFLDDENLGDVWQHPNIAANDATNGLMPFHKLSQWLCYSLLEPISWAGLEIIDLDQLTGLAEYRNGGLFIDGGVLTLKNAEMANQPIAPDHPFIVEWRALTVALLDQLHPIVVQKIGISADRFPLACLLEGGSWAAGRKMAYARDPAGSPPVQIKSDGTVF